ncbi:Bax inhibitor-1/YccA family protein [Halomonas halocynthiae]|uniref:Bax inhibitor-1/YccA family protein n=1 Tax=Halomonas halocynthiae TaxID=176290 RepID=UPI0004291E22|nr:Bax inhibitor-1/YccA family protein [Halomonas halocynthiae]
MAFNDTRLSTQQTQVSSELTTKVLRNTYGLLAMTLVFSAMMAGLSMVMNFAQPNFIIMLVGIYGLMFLVHKTANSAMGLVSIFAFTGFLGYTLGPILNTYLKLPNGSELIMTAMAMTGVTFLGLSAVALITRKDFGFLANFMFAGFIVLALAMLAGLFFQIPALHLMISAGFVLFSSAAILYQTSEIVHRAGQTNYILATITLFVSIYNLFLGLLSLLGFASSD